MNHIIRFYISDSESRCVIIKINSENKSSIFSVLITVLFFFMLIIFLISSILSPDRSYSESENRNLSNFPDISFSNIINGGFMSGFENYMSDQFINRNTLVGYKTVISRILGNTEINDVYIGKNARLYEVPSAYDENKIKDTTDAMNAFINNCGIENKYFMLVPNATFIIPENLPLFASPENQKEIIDIINNSVSDSVKTIDCVSAFQNYSDREKLYFNTDHHWTSYAAYVAFSEYAKTAEIEFNPDNYSEIVLTDSFYGTLASSSGVYNNKDIIRAILPDNIDGTYMVENSETKEKSASVFVPEKLLQKNSYEVFFGGNFSKIVISTINANNKNLLVFKDSFANCFLPLLIPHYENIVIIDPRYFSGEISNVLEDYNFTDVLYIYNLNTFLEDTVLKDISIN